MDVLEVIWDSGYEEKFGNPNPQYEDPSELSFEWKGNYQDWV